jgi:hypothetical protein
MITGFNLATLRLDTSNRHLVRTIGPDRTQGPLFPHEFLGPVKVPVLIILACKAKFKMLAFLIRLRHSNQLDYP